jgi:hypothetical protein
MNMTKIKSWVRYQGHRLKKSRHYKLTQEVLRFLLDENRPCIMTGEERRGMADYLRHNLAATHNAPFVLKYKYGKQRMAFDKGRGLHYALTDEGRRLYFKRGTPKKLAARTYKGLRTEQAPESAHNYCFDNFAVTPGTIIADVGAAEGNFTLKFIDKISKAYLFESDSEWLEALEATFSPWWRKVEIINKYVGAASGKNCVTLDAFFQGKEKPTALKLDVEGAESAVLAGASGLLEGACVSDLLVCAYHRRGDAEQLSGVLQGKAYKIRISPGYMLLTRGTGFSPEAPFDFRKGLIHARKI